MVTQLAAEALRIREQPKRPLVETLADRLRSKRLLLVLDNCEHLLDACAKLAGALLKTCFNLRILATSREAIGVAGESICQVPSLATPEPTATMSLESLCQFEAVRLFKDRAVAVQPRFALTSATAPAVVQICWRVEGIPLAIELAAARMSALSAAQVAERLAGQFSVALARKAHGLAAPPGAAGDHRLELCAADGRGAELVSAAFRFCRRI
jgi:non-specific serine/threonine protein kinase